MSLFGLILTSYMTVPLAAVEVPAVDSSATCSRSRVRVQMVPARQISPPCAGLTRLDRMYRV